MAAGIYMVRNVINNKFYIGSTTRLTARKAEHKYKRKTNKGNSIIRNAVLKYGENNFLFEIIEVLEFGDWCTRQYKDEVLTSREQFYVDTLLPKYNIKTEDVTRNTQPCSEKQKIHLQTIAKLPKDRSSYSKPIYQLDKDGNIIKEFKYANLAEEELNLYKGSVCRVLSGEYTHTKNYYFKYK